MERPINTGVGTEEDGITPGGGPDISDGGPPGGWDIFPVSFRCYKMLRLYQGRYRGE